MSRNKQQWIERTGGFRVGETQEQFQARVAEILRLEQALRDGYLMEPVSAERAERIRKGEEIVEDIDPEQILRRLCELKGIHFDSYDDPEDDDF